MDVAMIPMEGEKVEVTIASSYSIVYINVFSFETNCINITKDNPM
jgi:hypothetical protein